MTKPKPKSDFKLVATPVKSMTETQKRHAITRINEIRNEKLKPSNEYISKGSVSAAEMHAAIKNGTAKLLPFSKDWEGGDWFDFPAKKKLEAEYAKKKSDQTKRADAIKNEAKRLLDQIQLKNPDSATVLGWIEKFEKF